MNHHYVHLIFYDNFYRPIRQKNKKEKYINSNDMGFRMCLENIKKNKMQKKKINK